MYRFVLVLALCSSAVLAADSKPVASVSVVAHVRAFANEALRYVKPYIIGAAVRGHDDGSARPANGGEQQPVWDEPSGRIPTRTERGRTCLMGDVSRFMPTPFGDWLKMLGVWK
jgi:hypothetical protein